MIRALTCHEEQNSIDIFFIANFSKLIDLNTYNPTSQVYLIEQVVLILEILGDTEEVTNHQMNSIMF